MVQNHRLTSAKHHRAIRVNVNDVSIVIRGWIGDAVGAEGGVVAVVVRFPTTMQVVVSAKLGEGDNIIDELRDAVDNALKIDF
jgi:hypothetical protein